MAVERAVDRFASGVDYLPQSGTVAASAAHTASADWQVTNKGASHLIVVIDATAKTSTPSVVFTIRGFDPTSGATWDILSGAAVTDVGTQVLQVGNSVVSVTNEVQNAVLPEHIQIHAEAADSNSLTYSIAAVLAP